MAWIGLIGARLRRFFAALPAARSLLGRLSTAAAAASLGDSAAGAAGLQGCSCCSKSSAGSRTVALCPGPAALALLCAGDASCFSSRAQVRLSASSSALLLERLIERLKRVSGAR